VLSLTHIDELMCVLCHRQIPLRVRRLRNSIHPK
jgi:hypothetical protein